ncbi:hypothetical protein RhiirA4_458686 [Rhizophagus irregularis]|uniref:Uncharacterized protein n=1 Tax=Rhizophagus irregularis TaxID=588596 RepID=A0A2I1GCP4_9GLOM|nr:hypothetical protein RhiirA4_458686 [Rhizophagus irregularis]
MESNNHLWTCSEIRDIIIDCFKRIGYKLIDLIRQHANKHSLTITDSIRYSPTFRWAFRNEPIHPVAILFLKSYVTNDLVGIFRNHFNTSKNMHKHLLPFMHECSITFKNDIWKVRNKRWKNRRSELGLTKRDFINYRKNFPSSSNTNVVGSVPNRQITRSNEHGYINPYNEFQCTEIIDYSSPICTDAQFIYNV